MTSLNSNDNPVLAAIWDNEEDETAFSGFIAEVNPDRMTGGLCPKCGEWLDVMVEMPNEELPPGQTLKATFFCKTCDGAPNDNPPLSGHLQLG